MHQPKSNDAPWHIFWPGLVWPLPEASKYGAQVDEGSPRSQLWKSGGRGLIKEYSILPRAPASLWMVSERRRGGGVGNRNIPKSISMDFAQ